jgi:predicted phage replisome organizer
MSEKKRYYWIKLKESFMTSDAVDFLMSQPDGANYVVLYQMLCLKTINTGGKLERHIGEVIIPYDEAKIQRDTKYFNIDTVRVALTLYKSLGLIYVDNDGALCLTDHENLVGSETNWKEIKQKQRAKKLPVLNDGKRLNSNTLLLPTGERQIVDEKRYGGNGMKAFDLAGYCCEMCGANTGLVIHHANEYSNDIDDLYILCTTCHGIVHSESTPSDWLHHTRSGQAGGQVGGQDGGHVHLNVHPDIDIRDRDKSIEKDIEIEKEDTPLKGGTGGRKKSKSFVPPTLEEVKAYCKERNSSVDPNHFFEYFDVGKWIDSKGEPVRNWKQKLITWEQKGGSSSRGGGRTDRRREEHDYEADMEDTL